MQKKFDKFYSEIDWLGNEYRTCITDNYGLFTWKKIPEYNTTRPFFRLESELKIQKLQECLKMFELWEASFTHAFSNLERELSDYERRIEECYRDQ